jgi:hypothetical protein
MRTLSLLLLLTLGFLPTAQAKEAASKEKKRAVASTGSEDPADGKVHILQMDDDYPVEEFEDEKEVVVHRKKYRIDPYALPSFDVQRRLLEQAGLAEVLKWESVKIDTFYGTVGQQDMAYVVERYAGRVSEKKIRRLRALIDAWRAEIIKEQGQ